MDPSIRPRPSNYYKPRVSVVKKRGWTNYLVRAPIFVLKPDERGTLQPVAAGHINVARKSSLHDAMSCAAGLDALWVCENVE